MITSPLTTTTRIGIGYSQKDNSFEAGIEIAKQAMANGPLNNQTLVLLFASQDHHHPGLVDGMRSILGEKPSFVGGTTSGILTNSFMSYTGSMAGAAFISMDKSFYHVYFEENIKDREREGGKALGKKIMRDGLDIANLLLFYDSVKTTSDEGTPMFMSSVPILEGLYSELQKWPLVAGIGVMGDMNLSRPTPIWVNQKTMRHGLAAITIDAPLRIDTVILAGVYPASGYHTITRAVDNIIYEIDGKPALEVIDSILGGTMSWDEYPLFITLGVNNGDKFADFNHENYSSRFCMAIDKEKKALIMIETDLKQGQEVQLMRRDFDFKYIQPQVDRLFDKLGNRKPIMAFYIDCIARVAAYSGMPEEESLEVVRLIRDIPCFGIFSGTEITNIASTVKPLDWTGVLCMISEPE